MAQLTPISWTTRSWNPVSGCSHVSDGCKFCYAETLSRRFGRTQKPWGAQYAAENVKLHPDRLRQPFKFKPGERCFVNSMSDLWHEQIPDDFIAQIFEVMRACPRVTFQILTKRPERAAAWHGRWPANVHMGTSVEAPRVLHRIESLKEVGAEVKFLSLEPLLAPLRPEIDRVIDGIDWVIVGGESGTHMKAHPERWMRLEWATELRDLCVERGIAFFFKQASGFRNEQEPYLPDEFGRPMVWHQFPGELTEPYVYGEWKPKEAQLPMF